MKLIKFKSYGDYEDNDEYYEIWINLDLVHSIYDYKGNRKGVNSVLNYGMNYLECVYLKETADEVAERIKRFISENKKIYI